ncbi:MAG: CBS domain-containing protein [Lachnospiraceae bacterium]|nr:CBS domain-containing protein [Robinsoniella sp.]MDY3765774.1 CBS domain-containing protein [Lachnospiraceae bacterium]
MNILFFLKPKSEVAYLYEDYSLSQTLEKMEYHKYSAIPIIDREGHYVGTLTEGDLLRYIKDEAQLDLKAAQNTPLEAVKRRWYNDPVNINCNMEDLLMTSMNQNFVPVIDDDRRFIGIITRKDIIQYFYENYRECLEDAEK